MIGKPPWELQVLLKFLFLLAGEIFVKQKSMGNNSFGVKPFPDYYAPGPWSKMVRTLFNKIVCNSWF